MIAATRGLHPPSLDGDSSVGGKERRKATEFYADPANKKKKFKFAAYKQPDIVAALEAMFGQKCCYCESDYGAVAPTDIEHYRPKGAVLDPDGTIRKPGYYWLAAEWTNLLPSCIDCNRERGHEYDEGREVTGKANKFPLVDESKRATDPEDKLEEDPLLLDPALDDPDEHLEFFGEGLVRAALRGGAESERGEQTIKIVGLRRPKLVSTRVTQLRWIKSAITGFEEAVAELDVNPDNGFAHSVLRREMEDMATLMAPSSPYTAMARQLIQPVLDEAGVILP
jgi:uncharacterized protein (TIGR02646 family)